MPSRNDQESGSHHTWGEEMRIWLSLPLPCYNLLHHIILNNRELRCARSLVKSAVQLALDTAAPAQQVETLLFRHVVAESRGFHGVVIVAAG